MDSLNRDWHDQLDDTEPTCGGAQWRTRDRQEVVFMCEMRLAHLHAAIDFATRYPQHASKLTALLAEAERRRGR
jgi:hypothetical protein